MKFNRKYFFEPGDDINGWKFVKYSDKKDKHYTKFAEVRCPKCDKSYIRSIYNLLYGKSPVCIKCAAKPRQYKKIIGDIPSQLFNSWKSSAKKRKLEFSVTPEYLNTILNIQNFKCALSGLDLIIAKEYKNVINSKNIFDFVTTTCSPDRIDSSLGYIEGNIQFVHKRINWMKSNMTDKEFIEFCTLVSNHNKINSNAELFI